VAYGAGFRQGREDDSSAWVGFGQDLEAEHGRAALAAAGALVLVVRAWLRSIPAVPSFEMLLHLTEC
jgi:hypothetical protein